MMPFKVVNNQSGDGIFFKEGIITEARNLNNVDVYKNGSPVDVGFEVSVPNTDAQGNTHVKKLSVTGNFKLLPDGSYSKSTVVGVEIALNRLKIRWKTIEDDGSFAPDVIQQLVGVKIGWIEYRTADVNENGKNKYKTYKNLVLAEGDWKTKLRAMFDKDVQSGWLSAYSPNGGEVAPAPSQEAPALTVVTTNAQF